MSIPTFAIYLMSNPTVDQSGQGHTLTVQTAPRRAPGPSSSGLAARGGRLVGDGTDFRTAGEVEVRALVNLDSSSGDRWIAGCEKQGTGGRTWWKFGVHSSRGLIYGFDYGTTQHQDIVVEAGLLPASGWVDVGFLREANGKTIRFRVGGIEVAMVTAVDVAAGGAAADLLVMNDAYNTQDHRIAQVFLDVRS